MLYELPFSRSHLTPNWPDGIGNIPVALPDGSVTGLPVLNGANILVTGTTGYGKTVLTKAAVRVQLNAMPETKGVFFQIKPDDFTSEFMKPGDKVITYSPHAGNPEYHFHWNMVKEIRQSADSEAEMKQLGSCLFNHLLQDDRNRLWAGAARDTFIAFLRVVVDCFQDCPSNGRMIQSMRSSSLAELLKYLSLHPRNHSLLRKTFGFDPMNPNAAYRPPRKAEDVLFFLSDVLELFSGNFMSFDGQDTIHDFLHEKACKNLFIQHDISQEEASRPFELFFLKKIIDDKMSPSTGISAPVLMVLDEVDKVRSDFGCTKAATLGRGYRLQLIVSTQSLENLYALSPENNREHAAKAMMAGFPVLIAFHGGDPDTIAALQTMFGSKHREITTLGISRYTAPVTRSELEPIVTDADLATLGIGECYVKILSCSPQKVKIIQK